MARPIVLAALALMLAGSGDRAWSAPRPTETPPPVPASPLPGSAASPLLRSPGYYPPADPESASVRLGRRKAKAVRMPLSAGSRSIRDLAQRILAALEAKDEKALHAARLTFSEFSVICWPEFPESRPITNISATDAWELSDPTSLSGAGRAISAFGGHPLKLLSVHIDHREPFRNFTLHRGVVIEAKDEADGRDLALKFAPSIVERQGRYKVLMFKD